MRLDKKNFTVLFGSGVTYFKSSSFIAFPQENLQVFNVCAFLCLTKCRASGAKLKLFLYLYLYKVQKYSNFPGLLTTNFFCTIFVLEKKLVDLFFKEKAALATLNQYDEET